MNRHEAIVQHAVTKTVASYLSNECYGVWRLGQLYRALHDNFIRSFPCLGGQGSLLGAGHVATRYMAREETMLLGLLDTGWHMRGRVTCHLVINVHSAEIPT